MRKQYVVKEGWRILRNLLPVQLARYNEFFFRFIPFQLSTVGLGVTDNCNAKCVTCLHWRYKSFNELSLDEIDTVLTQSKELGILHVILTGGEPTLREDLHEIVRKASALKFEEILLLTNGLLLTEDRVQKLLAAGLTSVTVSLDGLEERNDSIRGVKGYFDKAISALKTLSQLRDKTYPFLGISVAMILNKSTLNQVIPMMSLLSELKVRLALNLINNPLHSTPTARDNPNNFILSPVADVIDLTDFWIEDLHELDKVVDELHEGKAKYPSVFPLPHMHASLEYVRKYFRDPKREDIPCMLGHTVIDIGAHGEVYPGCGLLGPVGNIREKSLKEIIDSEEYKRKLHDIFYKRCPGCCCGYNMNLLYWVPWIKDEARWRIKLAIKGKKGKYCG
ncbi:radical SAM protein [Dehalococcoidia bacterium]|nr:radical SAM protein [Dehalococcoidia bacterium]